MVQNALQNWTWSKRILARFEMEIEMEIGKWPIQTNLYICVTFICGYPWLLALRTRFVKVYRLEGVYLECT